MRTDAILSENVDGWRKWGPKVAEIGTGCTKAHSGDLLFARGFLH